MSDPTNQNEERVMTFTNGANDPLPAERLRCVHCDEIIYRSSGVDEVCVGT